MKILALEFSSKLRSVAILETSADEIVSSVETLFGDKTAMELVDEALRSAGVEPGLISLIAVGLGPGSNAGIRSAISIAQGWHLGRRTPVVGVPKAEAETVELLAREGARRNPSDPAFLEPVYDREVAFVKAPTPRVY